MTWNLIGGAIVERMVDTGERPLVYDLRQEAVDHAAKLGAVPAASVAEPAALAQRSMSSNVERFASAAS